MNVYTIDGTPIIDGGVQKRYRILEYNVGNFSDGAITGYSGNDLDGYIEEWARFIGSCSADICLFTESRQYIDSSNTKSAKDNLYLHMFNNVTNYNPSVPWGVALASNSTQEEIRTVKFTNQSSSESKYCGALLNLNNIPVYVVSVHFVHGGSSTASVRIAQMEELLNAISGYDNVIIGGDFNTEDLSELATLKNAGFTFGNGGIFGENKTYSVSSPTLPLDNVGVKGNKVKLRAFNVLSDISLSDHMPTIAEVLVG